MALFGTKKNNETKAVTPAAKKAVAKVAKPAKAVKATKEVAVTAPAASAVSSSSGAILRPRITEKSGLLSQSGIYTFEVSQDSTKASISRAVIALYKVTPVKVAIVNLPSRNTFVKGRRGSVAGVRKALVTVKKGDKIDFV